MLAESFVRAASFLTEADALLVCAGAGMGVDSGLPDFRGNEGFWRAYPPFKKLGLSFVDLASPEWFHRDPRLAWGFYGHRLELYRNTVPHRGFQLLLSWMNKMPFGGFVFTSNVDGQFQKAGFSSDRIVECHGSIHHLQCVSPCSTDIWDADQFELDIDSRTFRARGDLPRCNQCGEVARPNILMFGDWSWLDQRVALQEERFEQWLTRLEQQKAKLVIIEIGAGMAVPTVRRTSERLVDSLGARLVRINPREADVPSGQIAIPASGLAALQALEEVLEWKARA